MLNANGNEIYNFNCKKDKEMYLVNYNPITHKVLGYLDPNLGFHATDDDTAYFSISNDDYAQYSLKPAWTDGKIITNTAPPNNFSELTVDGWVVNEKLRQKALEQAKENAKLSIDNAVIAIYDKFNPFAQEYALREAQAQAFADAGYKGEVPPQVQAVVEPTGLTPQQAADDILNQAVKLQTALDKLGQLRMQKLAVNNMADIEAVNAHRDQVLQSIALIAENL